MVSKKGSKSRIPKVGGPPNRLQRPKFSTCPPFPLPYPPQSATQGRHLPMLLSAAAAEFFALKKEKMLVSTGLSLPRRPCLPGRTQLCSLPSLLPASTSQRSWSVAWRPQPTMSLFIPGWAEPKSVSQLVHKHGLQWFLSGP